MLPDCLDSSAAATIKEMLLARRGNALVVDASQVRRVGVQPLQVLVAAARTWQSDGQGYRLENPSPEFLETIALVGLPREDLLLEGNQ
jgi:anti-anti-sigma regulatory factor